MPSVALFGRKWDTTTDVMPINFFLPALLNTAWVIAAIAGVVGRADDCPQTKTHATYQAARWGLFGTFSLSALLQIAIIISGLQGSPLEESKRWLAVPCLYGLLLVNFIELLFAVYGSVVIHQVQAPCRLDARAHKIVALSWAKLIFTMLWLTSCYRLFPATFDDAQGWLDRIKWIFSQLRRLGLRIGKLSDQDDGEQSHEEDESHHEEWHGQQQGEDEDNETRTAKKGKRVGPRKQGSKEDQLMHQLAATFRMILGDIDLTVSDRHVALVLASALQQMRRRRYVAKRLLPRDQWRESAGIDEHDDDDPEAQRSDAEAASTMLAPSNVASHMRPDLHPSQAAAQYVTDGRESVPADVLKEALVYLDYSNASYYIEGPTDPEQARQARENEFKKRRRSCCFVPLPSFLQPADAKQRAQAPPAEDVDPGAALRRAAASGHQLSQPEHDGTSGYESSASEGDVPSSHKRCAPATGRQPSADRGAAGPLRQRSGSGAVSSGGHASAGVSHAGREVQDGAGEAHDTAKGATGELDFDDPHKDMDIVYRKADNVVLGQLPYAIALDWKRKTVVLTCRGTSSLRDAVTDAIGQPIDLDLWLTDEDGEPPDEVKGLGPQAAHSGVLTAAAAVYKDLQRHRILEELLQGADIPPLPGQTSSSKSAQPSHARQSASGPAPGQHGTQQQQQQQRPHSSKPAIEQPASSSGHPDTQEGHELEASAQSTFGWLVSFLPGSASFRATGSRKGQGTGAVDVRVSTPPAAGQSQTDASGRGSRQGSKDMENADRSDSIGEHHEALAASVEEGQQMVADLVRASQPEDEGKPESRPEAKAEEERQLGSLRARKLNCEGWGLVTTGHSLGGGVAALLALKLRARFPHVKCWAMCPPGGLLTAELAHAMASYCTSIALGKDGVPRASLHSMVRLMDDAVEGLARGRRCKAHTILRNLRAGGRAKYQRPGEFHRLDRIPPEPRAALERYRKSREQTKHFIGKPTYPPGRIVYIRRLKDKDNQTSFDAVWIGNESIMAEGFLISGRMLKDHLVTAVEEGLRGALHALQPDLPSDQSSSNDDSSSHESELGSYDSDSAQTGILRLCLTGHMGKALHRAKRVRQKQTRKAKDHAQASRTGQVAHLSSAVDH